MWYNRVTQNLSLLPQFIDYYNDELQEAKTEVRIHGHVESNMKELPGLTEVRFNQLQEVEAVLEFLNKELRKIKHKHYKNYLEGYGRALTSRDAERYADAESEVIDFEMIVNEVALLRNRWLGIMKALDQKQWLLSNIVKLRTAGMEDVSV